MNDRDVAAASHRPILLPAEIRVREFDAKLLLACCLAERGLACFLGQRTEMDLMAGRFPPSVYVAKGLTKQSRRHLVSNRNFGHEIVAWDEEAICYCTREHYLARRVGEETVPLLSHLIAWGDDNAELWSEAAGRHNVPITVLGNPRTDLLRGEFRSLLAPQANELKKRYGRFILLNSNFGSTNNLIPDQTRFPEHLDPGRVRLNNRIGFIPEVAEWKLQMFRRMLEVPEFLARSFPDTTIIVRPHPAENHAVWQEAARGMSNVKVVYEGGVLPWITASACVVHSSCTTAMEAFLLDVPAVALRFPGGHRCDDDLPNLISYPARVKEDLPMLIAPALAGGLPPASNGGQSRELIARYVSSMSGALASDRIADFLFDLAHEAPPEPPATPVRLWQHGRVAMRKAKRLINSRRSGSPANAEWREHQFPQLTAAEVNHIIGEYSTRLSRFADVRARRIGPRLFEIRNRSPE